MGLAVLPARLKEEMELLKRVHPDRQGRPKQTKRSKKHADWVETFLPSYPKSTKQTSKKSYSRKSEKVFVHVLEDAGFTSARKREELHSSALSVRYRNRI